MMVALLCVVAIVVLVGGAVGELPPPEASYKILMLLPNTFKSHRNIFMALAEALAERRHQVVILSCLPNATNHSNISEFELQLPLCGANGLNMFALRRDRLDVYRKLRDRHLMMARKMYLTPGVMELYKIRKEFDLLVIDNMHNELAYPFVHEMPFISIETSGVDPIQSAVAGNVLNPSYAPSRISDIKDPTSLSQRFISAVNHIAFPFYHRRWATVPMIQKEITPQFPDLPPLLELQRNQSLTLINSHYSIGKSLPLLPSQVEVGAMHCRPAQSLPQDLESWISGAGPEGIIYFSLGSMAQGSSMPTEYRDAFIEAFRRLPHRVIWKHEGGLEGVSDNVLMKNWLPQQDILAHDKVKVFITHGGLLSMQESIYHGTPLLSVPIFGDQPRNALFVKSNGLGDMLVWEELTVDVLVSTLTEITTNPKYKENVEMVARSLRDQLTTPKERAVFWTEYVIRHQGAPQLRCQGAQLSWVEFLMLDVLAVLLIVLGITIHILYLVFRAISMEIFSHPKIYRK